MSRALWSYATGANGPGPAEYMWCVLRSLVGAAWGGLVFALVAWKLLQYNVVTKFQTAPATVLLLLLGVGCGQIGRAGVDALGGDGDKWLRLWRLYVLCVALCTWRAKMLRSVFDTCGPLGRAGFFALVAVAAPFTVGAAPMSSSTSISRASATRGCCTGSSTRSARACTSRTSSGGRSSSSTASCSC